MIIIEGWSSFVGFIMFVLKMERNHFFWFNISFRCKMVLCLSCMNFLSVFLSITSL